jgi:hypothetical protein
VTISPITERHLDYFRQHLGKKGQSHQLLRLLKRILYSIKSQKLAIGAIPVIEWFPNGRLKGSDAVGHVLALPTLGFRFDGGNDPDFPQWATKIRWTVRYKNVNWGQHDMSKCLLLPDSEMRSVLGLERSGKQKYID